MLKGTVNFRRRLARWMDLPPDVTAEVPRIQMVGSLQVMVENHQGLDFFSDSEILLRIRGGRIRIRGGEIGDSRNLSGGDVDRGPYCRNEVHGLGGEARWSNSSRER